VSGTGRGFGSAPLKKHKRCALLFQDNLTMRIYTLITIVTIGLTSCGRMSKGKPETTEMAIQDLELNDIVHDSLTTRQINDIKRIQQIFSEVNSSTLDETINNFKRDQHPDNEIAIWQKMADTYQRFTSRTNKAIGLDKKNEAYELILLRSMMTEGEVLQKYVPKVLTKDEVNEIFSYYSDPPQPVKVEKK